MIFRLSKKSVEKLMVAIDLHSKWNKDTMDVNGYCQQKKETHTGSETACGWVNDNNFHF